MTKAKGYIKGRKISLNDMLLHKQVFWNGKVKNVDFLKRIRMPIYGLVQNEIHEAILPNDTIDKAKLCYETAKAYREEWERLARVIKELDLEEERILIKLGVYTQIMEKGYDKTTKL